MTPTQLQDFLERHDLSDEAFAELIGVTAGAVHHWLKGIRRVPMTTARLLRLFDRHNELMHDFR